MNPEAFFKAYDALSWIPHEHVMKMRAFLSAADVSVLATMSTENRALAYVVMLTEECVPIWTTRRIVGEWPELTDETIH